MTRRLLASLVVTALAFALTARADQEPVKRPIKLDYPGALLNLHLFANQVRGVLLAVDRIRGARCWIDGDRPRLVRSGSWSVHAEQFGAGFQAVGRA